MSEPTPREELEKKVRNILDTRHTVRYGQSYTDTYAPRIVDLFNAEVLAVLDELEKSSYVPMTMGFGDRFYRIPTHKFDQLKQRYGGKEQENEILIL